MKSLLLITLMLVSFAGTAVAQTPTSAPATRPAQRTYTRPGTRFQQMDVAVAAVAVAATPSGMGAGRDAAEATALSAGAGVSGRTGLTAPQTMGINAVVGIPSLQEGPARGIGYASRIGTIFTPQRNPMSGPNGFNAQLRNAGFPGFVASARR